MRTAFFSVLALPALFISSFAAPAANPGADLVEKRSEATEAYSIVESLYSEIKQYTGAINSTAAGLSASSSAADNDTAAATFRTNVESITSAVNAAQAKVAALPVSKLVRRDTSTALASLVEDLFLEISGALNNIVSTLGLTSLLSSLQPLVSSLSGLLLALEVVVNDLLALVQQLLDGLLTGLSVGLSGLDL